MEEKQIIEIVAKNIKEDKEIAKEIIDLIIDNLLRRGSIAASIKGL